MARREWGGGGADTGVDAKGFEAYKCYGKYTPELRYARKSLHINSFIILFQNYRSKREGKVN